MNSKNKIKTNKEGNLKKRQFCQFTYEQSIASQYFLVSPELTGIIVIISTNNYWFRDNRHVMKRSTFIDPKKSWALLGMVLLVPNIYLM